VALCRVLEEDPDLAGDLEGARLDEATRRCLADEIVLSEKEWQPGLEAQQARDGFGLLVLEGVLIRHVGLPGRFGAELLGPGDLLRPWDTGEDTSLPFAVRFAVAERARIAILDRGFAVRAAPFPEVATTITGRAMSRVRNLALVMSIVHYPEVRQRLLLVLWHLADRWGRVTPQGVRIPLRLRHQLLAELVAARRPTVTAALTRLTEEGLVERDATGLVLVGDLTRALGQWSAGGPTTSTDRPPRAG
jgi:CRP/FNR family transcriptional regulator, cyclic AMP receptor protein